MRPTTSGGRFPLDLYSATMVLGECRQSLLMYAEPTPIVYHFNDTKVQKIIENAKHFRNFFRIFFYLLSPATTCSHSLRTGRPVRSYRDLRAVCSAAPVRRNRTQAVVLSDGMDGRKRQGFSLKGVEVVEVFSWFFKK